MSGRLTSVGAKAANAPDPDVLKCDFQKLSSAMSTKLGEMPPSFGSIGDRPQMGTPDRIVGRVDDAVPL